MNSGLLGLFLSQFQIGIAAFWALIFDVSAFDRLIRLCNT